MSVEKIIAEKVFECSEEHCSYKTNRPDNLKRHIDTVHEKIRETCECGASLCSTSIKRHKEKHCKKINESIGQKNHVESTSTVTVPVHKQNRRSVCFPVPNTVHSTNMNNNRSLRLHEKITIEVEIETHENGTIHDPIKIGELDLTVLPTDTVQTYMQDSAIRGTISR